MTDQPFEKKTRPIVCTKNNYTDADVAALDEWALSKCTYCVYGREVGELNNTPHLQIYFELKDAMSYSALNKKLFKAYFKKRKGTPKQAAGYCKKGNDYIKGVHTPQSYGAPDDEGWDYFYDNPAPTWDGKEYGEISMQGKRTDIDDPVEMIVHDKATMKQVAMEHPVSYVKYFKGFQNLRSLVLEPRSLDKMPEVIVLWGPTGTGKTRDAYIKYWPEEPHYVWKPSNGNWWDAYDGEKKIILDEFRGQMTWSDILGLLDRNQYRAPVKGGFVNIQADKFVITSPFPPHQWYKDDDRYDRFRQLERRITKVVELKGPLSSYVS